VLAGLPILIGGAVVLAIGLKIDNPYIDEEIFATLQGRQAVIVKILKKYGAYIKEAAAARDVPWQYIVGIIWKESTGINRTTGTFEPGHVKNFPEGTDKKYISSYGLMQVSWLTAGQEQRLVKTPEQLVNARTNIMIGAKLLKQKYDRYGQTWENAIMAYNGTPNTTATKNYLLAVSGAIDDINDLVNRGAVYV
jgi:hypothetical protein